MNPIKSLLKKDRSNALLDTLDMNKDYLHDVFMANIDATFLLDTEGNFLAVNKSGEKLLGVKEEEVLHKSFIPYIDEAYLEEMMKKFNQTTKGKHQVTTLSLLNKKSQTFKLYVTASPCLVEKKVCGILVIAKDMTNEEKLKESIKSKKELYNRYPDGVFTLSSNREIVEANESFITLTGYKEKGYDFPYDLVPEGFADDFTSKLDAAFSGDLVQFNSFIYNEDGIQIKAFVTLIPNVSEEDVDSVTIILKDITLLEKYEDSIQHVQRSFNEAQEIANIGSWEYNLIEDEGFWSKQLFRIFGMDEETATAPSFEEYLELLHPEDVEECVGAMTNTIENGKNFSHFSRIFRMDGEQRIVQITGKPVFGETQQVERIIGTFYDVTNLFEAKEKLAQKEKQIETIYNNLEEVIWSIDVTSRNVLFCSTGFEEIYGYTLDFVINHKGYWEKLLYPEDRNEVIQAIQGLFKGKKAFIQHRFVHSSGEVRWADTKCFPVINKEGQLIRIDGIMWDITEEKNAECRIQHLAYHDYLTDLPNRRQFDVKVQQLINQQDSDLKFAILLLDLDRFKHINDMLGHDIGDELLIAVSKRLKECIPDQHLVARMGGDEFAIILYDVTVEEAIRLSDLITSRVRNVYSIGEFELHVTTSIGISMYPFEENADVSTKSVLKNADTALYNAKHLGRDTFKIYTPSMNINSYKVYHLEKDMRQALTNNEFYIEYQSKVAAGTGEVIGAEALIRWQHPEWGKVSPGEFIPIAEESELICEIGEWLIHKVCIQIQEWKSQGVAPVPISINISPKQLLKRNLIEVIDSSLQAYGIQPELIEFELTETSLIQSSDTVFSTIDLIRAKGIKIALDDFGVGYSSITHLKKFDLNTIKIDKSFIDHIMEDSEDQIIISSLIQMAHGLGLTIVAEGVETLEQLQFLKQKDCDFIQGYLFSKPVSPQAFVALLKKRVIVPSPSTKQSITKNRRKYFRLNFKQPLEADMTISEFNGKKVNLGKTEILIEDMSLGGIRFLSQIHLPVRNDVVINIETDVLGHSLLFHGHVVWKNEYTSNVHQYGLQFTISEQETLKLSKIMNQLQLELKDKNSVSEGRFLSVSPKEYFR
ncbi:EAL domain-containing protein [Rossellomorea sp. YZS02]|uniref:EAL domain-containing protein n=1 Tax=Rossellomorea sp. YZS02 TaxID=3097358 RepID=UPI002A13E302|nr:EAL domain-containing protein [Rossellomorea sp. YZS02]MDX8344172.1 EAL domain-containing protein [Rossellomorea sp. YZS02]